jgi:hypothetical protein
VAVVRYRQRPMPWMRSTATCSRLDRPCTHIGVAAAVGRSSAPGRAHRRLGWRYALGDSGARRHNRDVPPRRAQARAYRATRRSDRSPGFLWGRAALRVAVARHREVIGGILNGGSAADDMGGIVEGGGRRGAARSFRMLTLVGSMVHFSSDVGGSKPGGTSCQVMTAAKMAARPRRSARAASRPSRR